MKAGFAERDITPDLPTDRPDGIGYGRPDTVHDPCKVRAAVFDDGTSRVALVGCDLESMLRSVVLAARSDIEAVCGIPPGRVVPWHPKFTTHPRNRPCRSHAPTTPTSGSIGPACPRMSGLPFPTVS